MALGKQNSLSVCASNFLTHLNDSDTTQGKLDRLRKKINGADFQHDPFLKSTCY